MTAFYPLRISKRVTLHTLHHSLATHLLECDVGIKVIQALQDIPNRRQRRDTLVLQLG